MLIYIACVLSSLVKLILYCIVVMSEMLLRRTAERLVNLQIYFTHRTEFPSTGGIEPCILMFTMQIHAYTTAKIRLFWRPVGIIHCRHYKLGAR